MMSVARDPNLLAKELNRFLVGRGGQEVAGLEGLDSKTLTSLSDSLRNFADQFEQLAGKNPLLAGLIGGEALRAFKDLAQVVSRQVDQAGQNSGVRSGLCGGANGVTGPLAQNGANFDPLASNACPAAALLAGAFAGAACGVATPNAVNALGAGTAPNANATGGNAQALSAGGPDPSGQALQSAGGGGGCFEDRVFAVMCKIVEDMQKKVEERLKKLQEQADAAEKGGGKGGKGGGLGGIVKGVVGMAAPVVGGMVGGPVGAMAGQAVGGALGGGGGGGAGGSGQESRNIEFEKIKFDMQKLSQMQQAMSNVLNTMDELAKSAIRHIKV